MIYFLGVELKMIDRGNGTRYPRPLKKEVDYPVNSSPKVNVSVFENALPPRLLEALKGYFTYQAKFQRERRKKRAGMKLTDRFVILFESIFGYSGWVALGEDSPEIVSIIIFLLEILILKIMAVFRYLHDLWPDVAFNAALWHLYPPADPSDQEGMKGQDYPAMGAHPDSDPYFADPAEAIQVAGLNLLISTRGKQLNRNWRLVGISNRTKEEVIIIQKDNDAILQDKPMQKYCEHKVLAKFDDEFRCKIFFVLC